MDERARESRKLRAKQLRLANKSEDVIIRKMEKRLKLRKKRLSTIPRAFVDDGLDYILEVCSSSMGTSEHDDDDFSMKTSSDLLHEPTCLINNIKKTKVPQKFFPLNSSHFITPEQDGLSFKKGLDQTNSKIKEHTMIKCSKENQLQQDVSNVPTSLDNPVLKRKLKGLINRVTEANLSSVLTSIETLFHENCRLAVQKMLGEIILESLVLPTQSSEKLIYELVLIIAALYSNLGSETGAYFLETVVAKFDYHFENIPIAEEKQVDNLLMIIACLYNYGIISTRLVIDILDMCCERFSARDVELIIKLLRATGPSLRRDNPSFLKSLINKIQPKMEIGIKDVSARVRFLLDTLFAITNNNMNKICSSLEVDLLDRSRKLLLNVTKKREFAAKLNISYEELIKAKDCGRWWLVGSAWKGKENSKTSVTYEESKHISESKCDGEDQNTIINSHLEKAKRLRLNTELRREIFCALMAADDYVDATERVLRLGLKPQQEKEIPFVTILCSVKESTYNPFYTFVVQKILHVHRRFRTAVTYAVWDHLKKIPAISRNQISNLAKLLAHLVGNASLEITVLKVDFTQMNSNNVFFLRQFLKGLLLNHEETDVLAVFSKLNSPKFSLLKEGLLLFLHHFLLKNLSQLCHSKDEEKMRKLVHKIQHVFQS